LLRLCAEATRRSLPAAEELSEEPPTEELPSKEQKWEATVAAAKDLFLQHGYERVRMKEVASAARLPVTTIQNYFSKEKLLAATGLSMVTEPAPIPAPCRRRWRWPVAAHQD
jgi:hypothetical protein